MPTRVTVTLTDSDRFGESAIIHTQDSFTTEHGITVLGFRPDRGHTIAVELTDEDGNSITAPAIDVMTDPLPAGFPELRMESRDSSRMEPGVTLISVNDYLALLDRDGEVVWLYHSPGLAPRDVHRLPNGNFVMNLRDWLSIVEIDPLGNVLESWHPGRSTSGSSGSIAVAADSFHHASLPTARGTLLTLSTELRAFDDYPMGELDPTPSPEPTNLIGDVIVELMPDGTVVDEWSLFDIVDPYRVGYDSFSLFWNEFYGDRGGGIDWSHANALAIDPSDGGMLVSLRHQDAVVKLDSAGNLIWILGPHDNWSPAFQPFLLEPVGSPFAWHYHQHGPEVLPNGNVLLFDNGNHRASPPDPAIDPTWSRVVEYAIDTDTMQVTQVWQYDAGKSLYAAFLGDADRLPQTGNILATFGGSARRIVEVTRSEPAEVVFEVSSTGTIDRAERLPSLYP